MNLTAPQVATLKTWIEQNHPAAPLTVDGSAEVAAALNAAANPSKTVWRSFVPLAEVLENGMVWTEVDALTVGKARIWEWMTGRVNTRFGEPGFEPAKPNVRAGLADAWASNTTTRANLLAKSKRPATTLEAIFATGTGTTQSPADLAVGSDGRLVEGAITANEVYLVRVSS